MIKLTNATDGREDLISCQLGDVENTIKNVGRLARHGMSETDKEIIRIMLSKGK